MTTKAKATSIRRKLATLGEELGTKYQNIETALLLERLVFRLVSEKSLAKHLVFKGGFVGLRVYDSDRYTVDLDALLVDADIKSTLALAKKKAEADLDDGVWFRFENQIDLTTQGEYGGVRQVYRAGIGEVPTNLKIAQIVHFDLGIGDPITPGPKKTKTPAILSQTQDISWFVYPIETIIAEKLHALISHGDINSRSKDVYDLAIFLPKADAVTLEKALNRCFEFRKTETPKSFSRVIANINTTVLERGWLSATASMTEGPSFETAFSTIIRYMTELEKTFKING